MIHLIVEQFDKYLDAGGIKDIAIIIVECTYVWTAKDMFE